MPFTHNRAERALRRAKVHMKIAGCFRTRDGAERFALLRGLVETDRQRGPSPTACGWARRPRYRSLSR